MSASAPLRVLIVGTGFGCRIQTPAFRGAGFDVVGLVGTDAERTAARAQASAVPAAFVNLETAIAATTPDVVAISTPPKTHADLAIRALRAGCHILCEKPFAMDATEARAMLAAAESAGKVHVIGNEFRFAPQRAAAARAIADGMIGEPRLGTFVQLMNFVSHFEDSFPDWWFTEESGGGWLGASGSHLVDQVRSWLGEFETVCASMANVALQRGQVDDTFSVHFRMESGLEGVLQQSTSAFGPFTEVTQVTGSLGTVWTDSDGLHVGDRSGSRLLPIPDDLILPPAPDLGADERQARPDWKIMAETEIAPYTQLCRALRARILGEEAVSPITIATFADGLANMRVMDAIRRSAAQGGRLVRIADC